MKKIMFNDHYGLTKAVLEGKKTMTRRLFNMTLHTEVEPGIFVESTPDSFVVGEDGTIFFVIGGKMAKVPAANQPKYKVGEIVAIAQKYKDIPDPFAGRGTIKSDALGWDNKMYVKADAMPHQIRITGVKIERLQSITPKECEMEGVLRSYIGYYVPGIECKDWEKESHVDTEDFHTWKLFPYQEKAFAALIDKTCRKGTWDKNPWVYVYSFELVK